MAAVDGEVAPGFERVREAFGRNFEHGGDVGAALCVYRHGRKVADLWAAWPGRAAGHRPSHPAGRPAGLGSDGGRAGRPAAGVGARHRPRVPRPDVRLARRRGHQAGQRPQRGAVLRRGDRRAGRARLLHRPSGGRTGPGQPHGHRRPAGTRDRRQYPDRAGARAVPPAAGGVHRPRFADEQGLRAGTTAAATAEQAAGTDQVLLVPSRFASGFMLPTDESPLGGPASFGHPGRGGSLGFADPDSGIAFGYVVSHIRQDMTDTRAATLVNAVRACVTD